MSDVRLIQGDCLEILPTLDAAQIAALITDPPYGMGWDPDSRRFSGGSTLSKTKRGSGKHQDQIVGDDRPFDPTIWTCFPKVILWGFNHFADRLLPATTLIWLKRLDDAFADRFSPMLRSAWMKGGVGVYCRRDLSDEASIAKKRVHPTQKPVGLMTWCIGRL